MDWSWLAWIGGAALGGAGVYTAWRGRNKPEADSAKSLSDAASTLVVSYRVEVVQLRAEVATLNQRLTAKDVEINSLANRTNIILQRVNELSAGIGVLVVQIENAGMVPLWRPAKEKP